MERKEEDPDLEYDKTSVYIYAGGEDWIEIYGDEYENVDPWEKITIDISSYCGSEEVSIRFDFNTVDELGNKFTGWLVDDVIITNKVYNLGINNKNYPTAGDELIWEVTKVDEVELERIFGSDWETYLGFVLGPGAFDLGAKRKYEIDWIETDYTFWVVHIDWWYWTTDDFADIANDTNYNIQIAKDGAESFGEPFSNQIIPLPVEDYLQDIEWNPPYVVDGRTVSGDYGDFEFVVKYCPTTGVWEKFQIKNATEDVVYEYELIFTGFSLGVEESDRFIYKIASFNEVLSYEYFGVDDIKDVFGPNAEVGAYECLEIYYLDYDPDWPGGGWIIDFEYWNWTTNLSYFDGPSDAQIEIYSFRDPEFLDYWMIGGVVYLSLLYSFHYVIFPVPIEFYLTQIEWPDGTEVVGRIVTQEIEIMPEIFIKEIGAYNTDGVMKNFKITTIDDEIILEIQLESAGGGNGDDGDEDDGGGDGGDDGNGDGGGGGGVVGGMVNFLLSPIGLIAVGGVTAAGVAVVIFVWILKKIGKR